MKHKTIKKRKISQDCWSLDTAFYDWLRERLPIYLKEAGAFVNLEYHKFTFRDKEYTQKELVERMIYLLRRAEVEYDLTKQFDEEQEVLEIWAIVAPAMWW